MITIRDLTVTYKAHNETYAALDRVSLSLDAGETCAIIGPSGCGKSTLLKVLAGIITKFEGSVTIHNEPVQPQQQKIGFIPQNYGLLPWKNIADNILLGAKIKGHAADISGEMPSLLQQLGLAGLEKRYPGELSGGQQQRVALARSFLLQPDLLLMDEPFSALDALTREEIQQVFLETWRTYNVTTVFVTHQVEEAVCLGQKIAILTTAPGSVGKIFDNPLFGQEDIRSQREFFQLCLELRNIIKKDWTI